MPQIQRCGYKHEKSGAACDLKLNKRCIYKMCAYHCECTCKLAPEFQCPAHKAYNNMLAGHVQRYNEDLYKRYNKLDHQ